LIFLLPNVGKQPATADLFEQVFAPEDQMPDAWMPNLRDARETQEAFAFPTALAQAELMKMVLDSRSSLQAHPYLSLYKLLVLGVTLGYLEIVLVDLVGDEADDFGLVLEATDQRCQYFGLLKASAKCGDIASLIYGGTSPDTLYWPCAPGRRSDKEWEKLKALIDKDNNLVNANYLLDDLKSLLLERELWNPVEVPWMNGFDRIIQGPKALDVRRRFDYHSRGAGPVLAKFPEIGQYPLYLPVYQEEFAANFLKTLTGTFKRENGSVGIYSQQKKTCEVLMPAVKPKTGDLILAGAGTVVNLSPISDSDHGAGKIRLKRENGDDGLFDLLQDLYTDLGNEDHRLYKSLGNGVELIKERPFFYPDVFRVVVARLGEAAGPEADVSYSEHAYRLAFEPESPGLPLEKELTDLTRGSLVEFQDASGHSRRAFYIDEYRGTKVNDILALGWALWMFFDQKAELRDNRLKASDDLRELMAFSSSGRPLAPSEVAYHQVSAAGSDGLIGYGRLATLQRFRRAYESKADPPGANKLQELCYHAALAFIKRVWSGSDVISNGRLTSSWQPAEVGNSLIYLAKDEA
jgi:hypothetical protein